MHAEALEWLATKTDPNLTGWGLDLGGRDINGTGRSNWPNVAWVGLDLQPGPGVHHTMDVTKLAPSNYWWSADIVLCTEVFEHVKNWPDILINAAHFLKSGGRLYVTAAAPERAPHSMHGGSLRGGEHYAGVDPAKLSIVTTGLGFLGVNITHRPEVGDVYMEAMKP